MVVLRTVPAARKWVQAARSTRRTLGLVPTMGALHEGHRSLFIEARRRCDRVVASIFVNPLQFGPGEDLDRYPRSFQQDRKIAREEGVDAIFAPSTSDMIPEPLEINVSPRRMGELLCGVSRPEHFTGVATIVAKLFNILQPDYAFFGQKDGQQAVILSRMVQDLNFHLKIVICPTIRDQDGLAISSRNLYLSPRQRELATVLYKALCRGEQLILTGIHNSDRIETEMQEIIKATDGVELDYAEVVDRWSLRKVKKMEGEVLLAGAVRIGKTRLIDNLIVRLPKKRQKV